MRNDLRIMHIVNSFDPSLGYAEYYLAKKQMELGFDVLVVCSDYPIRSGNVKESGLKNEDGIMVVRLKSACKIRGNVWVFNPISLANIVRHFSPDVVHCHGLLSPLSQEALLLKTRYRFSVVGDIVTGVISHVANVSLTQVAKHFLAPYLLNKVDAFFACNSAIERWIRDFLQTSTHRIYNIPLGADHELFKPDSVARSKTRFALRINQKDIVGIYAGKFLPSKRINDLLIASAPVIKRHNNFKVLLVGDGPESYKNEIRRLISKLGIEENVLLANTVHRTHLPNFFNAADFAVWPGAFSISIVEAMSCGLPLVIAKSDWTAHYLEYKNGFTFKAGDTHSLNLILLTLIENPKLRKSMGHKGRKLVNDKLNWDKITGQYVKIYRSVFQY